jgi:fatty aldehyde-generating acyl-ACP reductase
VSRDRSKDIPARFASIGHPVDLPQFRTYIDHLKPGKTFRDELIMKLFEWTPSYKVIDWPRVGFDSVNNAGGVMVMVPFIPEMRDIKLHTVVEKIEGALAIAAEEHCAVASLGAFTSIVLQGQERDYAEKYDIQITSGNTFTAALIVRSIERICERFAMPLGEQTVAIIGASGDIGSGCMLYLGQRVQKMILTARGIPLLKQRVESVRQALACEAEITGDNRRALQHASIVVFATSAYRDLFSVDDFTPGTVVCDASAPLNVKLPSQLRPDVFLYHGGIASLPFELDLGFDTGLASPRSMYGCQVEGLLIALDPSLPCSWGRGNITCEKLDRYLNALDMTPGLDVCFSAGSRLYSERELDEYGQQWAM